MKTQTRSSTKLILGAALAGATLLTAGCGRETLTLPQYMKDAPRTNEDQKKIVKIINIILVILTIFH